MGLRFKTKPHLNMGGQKDGLNQTAAFYVLENMTSRHILISGLDSFIIHIGSNHKRA